MTREEFLSKQWKAYPALPKEARDFIFGRVYSFKENQIQLIKNGNLTSITLSTEIQEDDKNMGSSIPLQFLIEGDVVAIHKSSIYLLAPCLKRSKNLFNKQQIEWSFFLNQVKSFFLKEEFLETQTPYLVESPGVDHHIDFFEVKGSRTERSWYLPTSPEINLKKHLCQGFDKIFEIKNCFRDDLPSPIHLPEFMMLEWYRAYEDLDKIKYDIKTLLEFLTNKELKFIDYTVSDCFKLYLDFNLTPSTSKEELKTLAQALRVDSNVTDDWNDVFFRIFMDKIEPRLKKIENPIFLSQFPYQQASLSKINAEGWSERFELYWQGIELANAYLEVNDPRENLKVFNNENAKRKKDQLPLARVDNQFFEELYSGMPPSSGVALGLNRLFMVLKGNVTI